MKKLIFVIALFAASMGAQTPQYLPVNAGPVYNALFYGADKSSLTDSTAAIQAAIAAAAAAGGGAVYLPSGHYKHTGLTLPTGVRLLGDSMAWIPGNAAGTDGTVLINTGTGANLTLTPDTGGVHNNGYTFEIAWLTLQGSTATGSGTDDGIDFLANTQTPARNGWVHDVRIVNFGRSGLQIYGTSYNHFERMFFGGNCGTTAINIPGGAGTITEFTWFSRMAIGACPTSIHVSAGDFLYFDHIDTGTNSATNVLIDGGFGHYFTNLSCSYPVNTCVEINAATQYVGRISFSNLEIGMAGNSTAEKGIWIHKSGSYAVFSVTFDHTDVYKSGSTIPTNWIVDTGSVASPFGLSMINTDMGISGSTASLGSSVGSYQTSLLNANFWSGNPNDADFTTIASGATSGFLAHSQSSGSTFFAHKLSFGATNCNGGPGWQFLGSTTAAARGSETFFGAMSICNNGNLVVSGQAHNFKWAQDSALSIVMQAGLTATQAAGTYINSYTGSNLWYYGMSSIGTWGVQELPSGLYREIHTSSGQTTINSGAGTAAIKMNSSANSGTGGLEVDSGGSSPVPWLKVTKVGSANKAVCWKSDGVTLGYCSVVVDSTGTCGTCN